MQLKPSLLSVLSSKRKAAKGFTTNFDDLGQTDGSYFDQIPGLASQRLMAEGYGFGAEGDWKSPALYRTVWVMNQGLPKGCSFLEDYTLNFDIQQFYPTVTYVGDLSAYRS